MREARDNGEGCHSSCERLQKADRAAMDLHKLFFPSALRSECPGAGSRYGLHSTLIFDITHNEWRIAKRWLYDQGHLVDLDGIIRLNLGKCGSCVPQRLFADARVVTNGGDLFEIPTCRGYLTTGPS
jgi:hypothetical protein